MSAGRTFPQLLRAGQWRGDAAHFFLDLDEGERRATAAILMEGSEEEPISTTVSFFLLGSRGLTPLLTSARRETFGAPGTSVSKYI